MDYNRYNFHTYTFCIWEEVSKDEILEFKINYKSKSGSQYIFTKNGVFRISNHWGRASNCRWRLEVLNDTKNQIYKIGFAKWTDFHPNNENEKLFFIKVDLNSKTVDFHHKNNSEYDGKAVIRNSGETSKIIKIIKQILSDEDWSKHLIFDDYEKLQKEIIHELINSDKSFLKIKRNYI